MISFFKVQKPCMKPPWKPHTFYTAILVVTRFSDHFKKKRWNNSVFTISKCIFVSKLTLVHSSVIPINILITDTVKNISFHTRKCGPRIVLISVVNNSGTCRSSIPRWSKLRDLFVGTCRQYWGLEFLKQLETCSSSQTPDGMHVCEECHAPSVCGHGEWGCKKSLVIAILEQIEQQKHASGCQL